MKNILKSHQVLNGGFLGLSLLLGTSASAVVLDFNDFTDPGDPFPGGLAQTLTGSFEVDATNAGDDVTFTFGGNVEAFSAAGGNQRPAIDPILSGGIPGNQGLNLFLDFDTVDDVINVTIDFNYAFGVTDFTIEVFDFDTGAGFIDQLNDIRLDGVLVSQADLIANSSGAGFTSGEGFVQGTGDFPSTGAAAAGGTFNLGFGDAVFSQLTFEYRSPSDFVPTPTGQGISFGVTSFTAVPEPKHFAWFAGLAVFALVVYRRSK